MLLTVDAERRPSVSSRSSLVTDFGEICEIGGSSSASGKAKAKTHGHDLIHVKISSKIN
jgi:hypothetical protein